MNLEKWHGLKEKTAELSLRERVILAGIVIVLVVFIWLQTFFASYEKQDKANASQLATLTQTQLDQSIRLGELTNLLAHDPNAALRKEQQRLNDSLQDLRAKIEKRMSNLIAPEAMANLMRQVLSDYKGLVLLSARNLPVEPLQMPASGDKASGNESDAQKPLAAADETQAVIFTHGFEMQLKGSYFQTVDFLQKLESMSGFYWRMLSYKVDKYPKATITIQLSTLSLEEDWIGV